MLLIKAFFAVAFATGVAAQVSDSANDGDRTQEAQSPPLFLTNSTQRKARPLTILIIFWLT